MHYNYILSLLLILIRNCSNVLSFFFEKSEAELNLKDYSCGMTRTRFENIDITPLQQYLFLHVHKGN